MEDKIVGRITNPKDRDGESIESVITLSFDAGDDGEEVTIQATEDPDFYLVVGKEALAKFFK